MDKHEEFMQKAIAEAKNGLFAGEIPVGCLVVKNNEIIGVGHNKRENESDISGHAEIVAMKDAGAKLGSWDLSGCSLYVTLEPCLMCAGAIKQARISSLFFGAYDPKFGANSFYHLFDNKDSYGPMLVYGGVCSEQCRELLDSFFLRARKDTRG